MASEFLDRTRELQRLEEWWEGRERMPINLYGRRRTGKSWLFRRFAHGKPAVLLVAHKLAPGAQYTAFSERLEPLMGVRPEIPDLPTLFRVLFRAGRERKYLAVIDEFPWLLPTGEAAIDRELSAIQAVIEEERDASKTKLILCGSAIGQMESLLAERNPLHGRLVPLQLRALPFHEAKLFLSKLGPVEQFERFAISGGMPRYINEFSNHDVKRSVCKTVLDRNGPLWDEARTIIEQELREPKIYFSILQQLSTGEKEINQIAQAIRVDTTSVSKYLTSLDSLRLVTRRLPLGAEVTARNGHWRLEDPFFRFWFRFVFPYQDELENGLRAEDLYDTEVQPALASHVSVVFEEWCRNWARQKFGAEASKFGAWWGPARNDLRRKGERQTEEIDLVGIGRNRVTVIGEAKWTNKKLDVDIVQELDEYKIPAMQQAGMKIAAVPKLLLFSKSGYSTKLVQLAKTDARISLVDVSSELAAD